MTGKFAVPAIVNAVITFGLITVPLAGLDIVFFESKLQRFNRGIKRILCPGIAANLFFLVLFSLYKRQSIVGGLLFLCEKINIKFLAVALSTELLAVGILKYGAASVRNCKICAPKPVLALFFTSFLLINGAIMFRQLYGILPVEQLVFHMAMPNTGANFRMIQEVAAITIIDSLILFVVLVLLLSLEVKFKNRCFRIVIGKKCQWIVAVLFLAFGLGFSVLNVGILSYMRSLSKGPSNFYEENYIDPNDVEITFPDQKRNLIVIFVESLETGFLTPENGGAFSERLMPEIEELMSNNINFSAGDGLGGAHEVYGTGWTAAGIVAQYSGVPTTLGFLDRADWNSYQTDETTFLPEAAGVGDILYKAGYKNYFILGSKIEFGGRDKYFKAHKDTVFYDYSYFRDNNYISDDYNVWWGFEDRKLYEFSKERIVEIARDAPFFVTMLTADTHPPGGHLDADALEVFDSRYMNVLFDMSRQLGDFLEWLKEQEFYGNTTVVVVGDHLYQDSSIFPENYQIYSLSSRYDASYHQGGLGNKYKRFPVNIFINSLLSEENTKNRVFSHFDIFPALIDAIGGVYDAKGLALGRSMSKGERTLLEELGVDYVNAVLQQRSNYYNTLWGLLPDPASGSAGLPPMATDQLPR